MASVAQIIANRANALHSTGPKTEEGKARSSRNRLTHGLCGPHTLLPDEDPSEYQDLLDALLEEHDPAGPTETLLIAQMAQAQWKLNRIARIEANLFTAPHPTIALNPNRDPEEAAADDEHPASAPRSPISSLLSPDSCIRYESAAHRAFDRALANLLKLKSARTPKPPSRAQLESIANAHLDNLIETRLKAPIPRQDSNPIPPEPAQLPPCDSNPIPAPDAQAVLARRGEVWAGLQARLHDQTKPFDFDEASAFVSAGLTGLPFSESGTE